MSAWQSDPTSIQAGARAISACLQQAIASHGSAPIGRHGGSELAIMLERDVSAALARVKERYAMGVLPETAIVVKEWLDECEAAVKGCSVVAAFWFAPLADAEAINLDRLAPRAVRIPLCSSTSTPRMDQCTAPLSQLSQEVGAVSGSCATAAAEAVGVLWSKKGGFYYTRATVVGWLESNESGVYMPSGIRTQIVDLLAAVAQVSPLSTEKARDAKCLKNIFSAPATKLVHVPRCARVALKSIIDKNVQADPIRLPAFTPAGTIQPWLSQIIEDRDLTWTRRIDETVGLAAVVWDSETLDNGTRAKLKESGVIIEPPIQW